MKRVLRVMIYLVLVMSLMLTCVPANAFQLAFGKPALRVTETVLIPGAMDADQQIRTIEIKSEPVTMLPYGEEEYLTDVGAAAAVLRQAMVNREDTVTVLFEADASLTFKEVVASIREAALAHTGQPKEGDYLEWQRGTIQAGGSYYPGGQTNQYTIDFNIAYYTTAEQEAMVDAAAEHLLESLNLDGLSDYETLCAVYDWICENVTYDFDNLNNASYDLKYTAYAALIDRTAVCQGYALLLYRLMLTEGIDCRVITGIGNGGAHAWNIVELDGKYYNLDATWDASWKQAGLEYNYFLRAEATFEDHFRDEAYTTEDFYTEYPMNDTDYIPSAVAVIDSGKCGENLTWTLTDDGVLTISGNGEMEDYTSDQYETGGAPWSGWRSEIITVVLEEGVTSIGDMAFASCVNLTNSSIPDGITSIGEKTFYNCSKLTEIVIPNSVTSIGSAAFSGCSSLESITIPFVGASVQTSYNETTLFGYIFGKEEFENSVRITQEFNPDIWDGSEDYYIPASLRTVTVTGGGSTNDYKIPNGAFSGCKKITDIILGDGVWGVGDNAFRHCKALTSIDIPRGPIGEYAFYNCTGLTTVILPYERMANDNAFEYCDNIWHVLFRGSWTDWATYPFSSDPTRHYDCSGDEVISVDNKICILCCEHALDDGEIVLPTCTEQGYTTGVCTLCGQIVQIDFVDALGHNYSSLVTAPTCTEQGYTTHTCTACADSYKDSFTDALGHELVDGACIRCGFAAKASGVCGDNLTWLLSLDGVLTISGTGDMWDFENEIWALESVRECPWIAYTDEIVGLVVEDGVTSIGYSAFFECKNLRTIDFGNTVTSIGFAAFVYCDAVQTVTLPETLTSIGENAFSYCEQLASVVIPSQVSFFGACCFEHCSNLTYVEIKSSPDVGGIIAGNGMFAACPKLENIFVEEGHAALRSYDGVLFLENTLFQYPAGKKDTEWTIPYGTTELFQDSFKGALYLKEVSIPDSVNAIGIAAFSYCENLTHIIIPEGITSIADWTFDNCINLTNIEIPESVNSIGYYAFNHCQSLTALALPDSVTFIDNGAFSDCSGLTSLMLPKGLTNIADWMFCRCSNLTSIILPDGITSIGDYAFYDCVSLESITLPDGVAFIGNGAFSRCTALTSIRIPDGVTSISNDTFSDCIALTDVILPNGMCTIGSFAFQRCSSLTSFTVPECVTDIGYGAFYCCTNLMSVTMQNSVNSIDEFAFASCDALWHVLFEGSEEQWNAISIAAENYSLESATVHYNCTGEEITDLENKICTVCIANCSHQWNAGQITKEATCVEDGEAVYTCDLCHTTETRPVTAPGHSHTPEVTVAPTCESPGVKTYTCHCGDTYSEEIAPTGHAEVVDAAVAPTCTTTGLTEGKHCSVCGEILVAQTEIAVVEHSYITEVIAPTCTEKGYTVHSCSACGATYTSDHVEPLGHRYEDVVTEPTCTEDGSITHTCHCGDSYTDVIPATGHETTHTENAKEATCGVEGYTGDQVCDKCGVTVETGTKIEATGAHEYGEWIVIQEPTTEESGLREHYCQHCGHAEQEVMDPIAELMGDMNGDGRINARDVRALLRYIAGMADESEISVAAADYNGDGRINVRDARAILNYIAGMG